MRGNPPILCHTVKATCATAKPLSGVKTVDTKRRNRHKTRTIAVFNASPAVGGTQWHPFVADIIQVERRVHTFQPTTGLGKISLDTSFFLSNRAIDASLAADAIRKYWRIENKLHYTRDVTLCEDESCIRKNPGIFARLRSSGYNILRFNQSGTIPSRPLRRSPRRPQISSLNELL
jgi:hypothetical protein